MTRIECEDAVHVKQHCSCRRCLKVGALTTLALLVLVFVCFIAGVMVYRTVGADVHAENRLWYTLLFGLGLVSFVFVCVFTCGMFVSVCTV